MGAATRVWKLEGNLQGSADLRDRKQVFRLGGKPFYSLNHVAGPFLFMDWRLQRGPTWAPGPCVKWGKDKRLDRVLNVKLGLSD